MPKATPVKYSFNAGELSPLMDGRTDQAKYYSGASICENFIPTVQGPIIRRGGTYFCNEVKNSASRTWLRRFMFNVNQSYMLEFGDRYIRFYTNRGVVLQGAPAAYNGAAAYNIGDLVSSGGTNYYCIASTTGNAPPNASYWYPQPATGEYEIPTPYAGADLTDSDGNLRLNFRQSGDVLYITHNGNSYQTQKLSHLGALDWTLAPVNLSNGPFKTVNTDPTQTVYATFASVSVTGAANNGSGLIRLTVTSTAAMTTGNSIDVANVGGTTEANGTWIVTVIDGTHVDLQGSAFTNAYISGGTATFSNVAGSPVTLNSNSGIFQNGHIGSLFLIQQPPSDTIKGWEAGKNVFSQEIRRASFNFYQAEQISGSAVISGVSLSSSCIVTATSHGFITGDFVFIDNVVGTVEVNKQWYYVKKLDNNRFYLLDPDDQTTFINSTGYTTYVSGGTAQKGKRTGGLEPVHTEGSRTDGDPGVNWTYLHSGFGVVQITGYVNANTVTGVVAPLSMIPNGAVGSLTPSYLWAASLFSNVEGWPELVALFRDRLCFTKGLSMALSVSSDYENFAAKIGGQVTPDAAISITLPDTNPSRWMMDANDLLVGTAGREIAVGKITPSDPLSPSNIEANKQTAYGSRAIEPVEVGNSILFVTRSGQKLREIVYDWTRNGYTSSDLTVLSEHIAKNGLSQITYQQEPYSIVWGCTAAGELVGFTFNREQDVLAWHRHPVGGAGIIESVQSIPSPDGRRDDLWLIVNRIIGGVTKRYVEFMMPEFDDDDSAIADAFYVDAGLTYSGSSTSTITGLDHLKGMTVDVLAQGGQHPQVVVGNTGSITLNYAVTKAQVGLPCPCTIRTMRVEAGSQLGTSQGKIKRITRLLMRLLNTLGGKYGPDADHLDALQYREANAPMDAPPALSSGDRNLPFPAGYDTDGYVMVYNDVPLPMTIVSIVTDVTTNES